MAEAANDPYLAAFEKPIPDLVKTFEQLGDKNSKSLKGAIEVLKNWD